MHCTEWIGARLRDYYSQYSADYAEEEDGKISSNSTVFASTSPSLPSRKSLGVKWGGKRRDGDKTTMSKFERPTFGFR